MIQSSFLYSLILHDKVLLNMLTFLTEILDVVLLFIKTERGTSFECEKILAFHDGGDWDLGGDDDGEGGR